MELATLIHRDHLVREVQLDLVLGRSVEAKYDDELSFSSFHILNTFLSYFSFWLPFATIRVTLFLVWFPSCKHLIQHL